MRYSVITPSKGLRPKALGLAADSVRTAMNEAGLSQDCVEMLVGFDGTKGERVRQDAFIRWMDFPFDGDYGNAIRNGLIKAARGSRLLFLDDDNALAPQAFSVYDRYACMDMVVGRIDTSRAFDVRFIPRDDNRPTITPGNVDPLCLCLSRELVLYRCGGWQGSMAHDNTARHRYESDFINIFRYWRRAATRHVTAETVGIYDAGSGLDTEGINPRQTLRMTAAEHDRERS